MGFYVRKSVRAGPFRFNLSKSGLGVSAGVPGFRIGTGPRGNYIRAGKGGVYYRASLGSRAEPSSDVRERPPGSAQVLLGADVPMEDISGATALELVSTGAGDLVEQLNQAASRVPLAPFALVALVVLAALIQGAAALVLLVVGALGVAWLGLRDKAHRMVVAFYDVEDEHARWLTDLVSAFEALSSAQRLWRVMAAGNVQTTYQYKVNSGASRIVKRLDAKAGLGGPRRLATNIAVPSVRCGRQALHFLPDRLLVRDGRRFSDVAYEVLKTSFSAGRFIEDGRVPRDGQEVDTTWRYLNVKGGPDRRYKNNRKLPVMLYGNVELASDGGLYWLLQCSRASLAEIAAHSIGVAPKSVAREQEASTTATP
jgi:DNA polymerase III subunit epsilon